MHRLKKEHESIRQVTVKAILGEQGTLKEDANLIKLEQEEVRNRLSTSHTKATKDPDPFHQLYEVRKGNLVKYSTKSSPYNTTNYIELSHSYTSCFQSLILLSIICKVLLRGHPNIKTI